MFKYILYQDADAIIFVYDITNENSFKFIKNFLFEDTKENLVDEKPLYAVVAAKSDLNIYKRVSDDEGIEFADKIGGIFQITSASFDFGISRLFENIWKTIIKPGYDYKAEDKKAQEEYIKKKIQCNNLPLSKYLNL